MTFKEDCKEYMEAALDDYRQKIETKAVEIANNLGFHNEVHGVHVEAAAEYLKHMRFTGQWLNTHRLNAGYRIDQCTLAIVEGDQSEKALAKIGRHTLELLGMHY